MNIPKIIFIDWNKTLSHSLFWEQLKTEEHTYHLYGDQIIHSLFNIDANLINNWMLGKQTTEDVCNLISEHVQLPANIIQEELIVSCQNMTFIDEAIPSLLAKIREKGMRVVVATDNMDTFRRFTMPALKLEEHFDDFLISSELGVFKYTFIDDKIPFFDAYLQTYNATYGDVALLDDSPEPTGTYERKGFVIRDVQDKSDLIRYLKEYAA
jgi:FMN phosphatase YigB (HAD superfamily)